MANKLALMGGQPLYDINDYKFAEWPPVSEKTANHLRDLYFSRAWSFNSEKEQEFEKAFAAYHGAKHGIFMSNGTVTLECALLALGVGPGDEVVVPNLTWIATAMAVNYVGAKCIFADIEKTTFCLDPASFERAITPRTKAVIPVHLYGGMADIDKILEIANRHGIKVIEDCAHMQGGFWNGRGCGSWGDVGSFSFQQSKTLAAGESGICITNDDELADRLYRAKHIGYSRSAKQGAASSKPPQGLICHNYRGLAMMAQILLDQLEDLPEIIRRYNEFRDILAERIADIPDVRLQSKGRLASPQGFYNQGMTFEGCLSEFPMHTVLLAIAAEGIRSLVGNYGPVHKHQLFNMDPKDYGFAPGGTVNTQYVSDRSGGLFHYAMYYPEMAERVAAAIRKVVENKDELKDYVPEKK
ncbi:MAG: DegT/DnrJ/EryC1/StrS family aminotransferase [Victivallales bacterium]|nr:DegT/DnrJ/EryC1/StrS family aminotransferase [Victivallales bacterium]